MAKELFDLPLNATPALTRRLAHGTPIDTGENMTIGDLVNLINGGCLKKVIQIGAWDMVADATKDVTHGLTLSKIRSIKCELFTDAGTSGGDLLGISDEGGTLFHGAVMKNSTVVILSRPSGGPWDNYTSDEVNRGYVTIEYVP